MPFDALTNQQAAAARSQIKSACQPRRDCQHGRRSKRAPCLPERRHLERLTRSLPARRAPTVVEAAARDDSRSQNKQGSARLAAHTEAETETPTIVQYSSSSTRQGHHAPPDARLLVMRLRARDACTWDYGEHVRVRLHLPCVSSVCSCSTWRAGGRHVSEFVSPVHPPRTAHSISHCTFLIKSDPFHWQRDTRYFFDYYSTSNHLYI